jgi:phage-related protein
MSKEQGRVREHASLHQRRQVGVDECKSQGAGRELRRRKATPESRFWRFYTAPGQSSSVVKEELRALGTDAAAALGEAMKRYRDGESKRGEVKALTDSDGLHEIRIQLGTNPYRVIFCFDGPAILAVLAIYKNQNKLSRSDLAVAKDRRKIFMSNKE